MSTVILDDRTSSAVYSAGWGHAGSAAEFDHTTTWADTAGATARLTFQGTSVAVIGTIPKQEHGSESIGPLSSYSIDGSAPVQFRAVETNKIQYNQRFFQSPVLSSGTHTLTITNELNSDAMYIDFFQIVMDPNPPASSPVAPTPPAPLSSPPTPSVSPASPASPASSSPLPSPSLSPTSSGSALASTSASGSASMGSASAASASSPSSPSSPPTYVSYSTSYSVFEGSTIAITFATVITPTPSSAPAPLITADRGSSGSSSGTAAASASGATKRPSMAAIAGGISAAVMLTLLVLGVLLWRRRVRRRRNALNNFRSRFGNFLGSKSDSFWAPVNNPLTNASTTEQPLEALSPRSMQPTMSQPDSGNTNTAFYPYTRPQSFNPYSGYAPGAAHGNPDPVYAHPGAAPSVISMESASEISYYAQEQPHGQHYPSHAY